MSIDAFHESEMLDAVEPVFDRPVGAVGGCVSAEHALVDAVTELCAERLPAPSYASTPSV